MSTRSTTGCYTCKKRKKKCDETHPSCLSCGRLGLECEGYAPLENPDSRGVMRRTKATRGSAYSVGPSRITSLPSLPPANLERALAHGPAVVKETRSQEDDHPNILSKPNSPPHHSAARASNLRHDAPAERLAPDPAHTSSSSSLLVGELSTPLSTTEPNSAKILSHEPPDLSQDSSSDPCLPGPSTLLPSIKDCTASVVMPCDWDLDNAVSPTARRPSGRVGRRRSLHFRALEDEQDPEGVTLLMLKNLVPDPNTQNNALPFVLQSYARWITFVVFEPMKVVEGVRDMIIHQFSISQENRAWLIGAANVTRSIAKQSKPNSRNLLLLNQLQTNAHEAIKQARRDYATGECQLDTWEILFRLGRMLDVTAIFPFSGSLSTTIRILTDTAPVFRRACPEPLDQLVNLPNILLNPAAMLRYFVSSDILVSIATGRPLFFKYDVVYTPEAVENFKDGDSQFTNGPTGLPDPFLITIAWINALYEDYGTDVDPKYISNIEAQIASVDFSYIAVPSSPFVGICRQVVQECWRQAVYILLYMLLCGASADDIRVQRVVRAAIRLIDGVKPGRNPDVFLLLPMVVIGTATREVQDQDILIQRFQGLPECETPGANSHEYRLILLDVWKRTREEDRPAVWSDLRMASFNVAGI